MRYTSDSERVFDMLCIFSPDCLTGTVELCLWDAALIAVFPPVRDTESREMSPLWSKRRACKNGWTGEECTCESASRTMSQTLRDGRLRRVTILLVPRWHCPIGTEVRPPDGNMSSAVFKTAGVRVISDWPVLDKTGRMSEPS